MHAVLLNQPFATETRTLLARMSPAPPGSRMRLIDNAVRSMIAQVLWTRLGFLHVLAAHTSQAALLNWINPTGTAATAVNSPTFAVDRGYTGDGSTSYVDTGFAWNATPNFSQDSAHLGGWALTVGTGRVAGVSGNCFVIPNNGATERSCRINTATTLFVDDNLTIGHVVAVRRDSANQYSYRNGGSEATNAAASTALSATHFFILQGTTGFFNGQVALAHAGDQLSAAQVAALYAIFQNYLRGVGAA